MTSRTQPTNDPRQAYLETRQELIGLLERIKTTAENDLPCPDGETIHWGHVGSLGFYRDIAKQLSDAIHGEGVYAG
jgi:hypothetical protein